MKNTDTIKFLNYEWTLMSKLKNIKGRFTTIISRNQIDRCQIRYLDKLTDIKLEITSIINNDNTTTVTMAIPTARVRIDNDWLIVIFWYLTFLLLILILVLCSFTQYGLLAEHYYLTWIILYEILFCLKCPDVGQKPPYPLFIGPIFFKLSIYYFIRTKKR